MSLHNFSWPFLLNATQTPSAVYLSKVNWYYSARFWLSFGILGLVSNTLEMISIVYKRKQKHIFGATLLSLCIADVLGSLSFGVVGLTRILEYDGPHTIAISPNTNLSRAWRLGHACLFISVGCSFVHIIIVAVQRLFAVLAPIKFKTSFLYQHCVKTLGVVWFLLLVIGIFGFFYYEAIWYVSYVLTLIVCVAILLCYTAIVVKTFRRSNRRELSASRPKKANDKTHKVLKVSLGVTMSFIVCTLPHAVYYLFVRDVATLDFYNIVNAMISMNPLFDSLVYFTLYEQCVEKGRKQNSGPRLDGIQTRGVSLQNTVLPAAGSKDAQLSKNAAVT